MRREGRRGERSEGHFLDLGEKRGLPLPTEIPPDGSSLLATTPSFVQSYIMLLRHSLRLTQPLANSFLRRQATSASSSAPPSSTLAHWLKELPRSTIRQQDHVALSHVQGLVSTLELPEDGLAENWRQG